MVCPVSRYTESRKRTLNNVVGYTGKQRSLVYFTNYYICVINNYIIYSTMWTCSTHKTKCSWMKSWHKNSSTAVTQGNYTPSYSDPSRRSSLSGKTLAHGTSSFWMRRPNRKDWGGSVRPSRDWQVGGKNSIPAWSLLPRKLFVNVTLSSSSTNFPGANNESFTVWMVEQMSF